MKIIYIHHALRQKGNPPSQNDDIQPLGVKDAKIVSKLMEMMSGHLNIKAIYTSPYYRCVKTAEIINKHINVSIFKDIRLNEYTNTCEVLEDGRTVLKTESWLNCQQRIREAIKEIVFKYDEKDAVICVTSGVNITAFISLAFKIEPNENLPFPMVPSCSPIGFEIDKSCF